MSVARPVLADSDGSFCVSGNYIAYELRPFVGSRVTSHVLRIARFDPAGGTYSAGEAVLKDFQVHRLSCMADRVEISGWGQGFESYTVGLTAGQSLPILQHRSDPSAKFDAAKDSPEPQHFWSEPLGERALGHPSGHGFFLVITGSDKPGKGVINHRRVATLVEKNEKGVITRRLQLYQINHVETIDDGPACCGFEPLARDERLRMLLANQSQHVDTSLDTRPPDRVLSRGITLQT